ncbi:hypothetical protein M0805_007443 [Coniferiporia weirii]|nr:hypothetical protein M0805_007443 [Coniferiporia weirii]
MSAAEGFNVPDANDAFDDDFDSRLAERNALLQQTDPLEMRPVGPSQPHGKIPNTPSAVSTISFVLGGVFFASLSLFLSKLDVLASLEQTKQTGWWWMTPQLGFFLAAWSLFHWAEFSVTAGWNREKCSVDSFLLDNGSLYHIAHGTALTEYLLGLYFRPSWKAFPYVSTVGIVVTVLGQMLRSSAMIRASTNFSHAVAFKKAARHQLVTDGVYSWFRHPSYAGFYYWALGTQLVLQNTMSFILYSALLWRFFYRRIQSEEAALIRFFGDDYSRYRRRVGTKIPFVP